MHIQIPPSILTFLLLHLTIATLYHPRQVSSLFSSLSPTTLNSTSTSTSSSPPIPPSSPVPSSSSSTTTTTTPSTSSTTTTAIASTATACLCSSTLSGFYCGMRVIYGNSKHRVLDGKCDDNTLYDCTLAAGTPIESVGNGDIGYNPVHTRDCGNNGCYFYGGKNALGNDGCNDDWVLKSSLPAASA